MLFTVTEEMHTWAVKPKQHCARGGEEGANLFLLDMMAAQTIDLRTRPWGINPTNSVFIPQSLVLRSIVLG